MIKTKNKIKITKENFMPNNIYHEYVLYLSEEGIEYFNKCLEESIIELLKK